MDKEPALKKFKTGPVVSYQILVNGKWEWADEDKCRNHFRDYLDEHTLTAPLMFFDAETGEQI